MKVSKTSGYFGCVVEGIDLSRPLEDKTVADLIEVWDQYQFIVFPNQTLSPDDLERLAQHFGGNYKDLFVAPMDGYEYVCEVRREPEEETAIFGCAWHLDWFNATKPPNGTLLYAVEVPPIGGDTLFADQYKAYEDLTEDLKQIVNSNLGANSARGGYSLVAEKRDKGRSMKLIYSKEAHNFSLHPLSAAHPRTGRRAITANQGYTFKIDSLDPKLSEGILRQLFEHQTQPKYVYKHTWKKNDLILWDNNSLIHSATGGYKGHRRIMHRVNVK